MSQKLNYIKEFNKVVREIKFLSSTHDVSLANKLILIQQDLFDVQCDFDSFDCYNFFSNIFNILNLASDPNSILVNGCLDVLLKCTESRSVSLMRAVNFVNFLPAVIKLILNTQDVNGEKMVKLLTLTKNFIRSSNIELDEHNSKLVIEVLRDCIENSRDDSQISKISLNILSDLIMRNVTARHQVIRIIKASKLQDKVDKSSDLIGLKFLIVLANEVDPKDFKHLLTLSFRSIRNGITAFDVEPVLHSLDLVEYAERSKVERSICDSEENLKNLEDLIKSLISTLENNPEQSTEKDEFFKCIFQYFGNLMKIDKTVAPLMEEFAEKSLELSPDFMRSQRALNFLNTFMHNMGQLPRNIVEGIVHKFCNETEDDKITQDEKSFFMKFLQVCHDRGFLTVDDFNSIADYTTTLIDEYKASKVHEADQDFIFLMIHVVKTLSVLSNEANIFHEKLNELLTHEHFPIVLARAFLTKDKEILVNLMTFGSIENYPTERVAQLLSNSSQMALVMEDKKNQARQQEASSSSISSKFINRVMGQELNSLIGRINEKLDNNELDTLKSSDMIAIYRHKNNYFNDHLNALSASLEKYTDLCQELQHQNAVLRKMGERQELINWCLEMDKEYLQKENKILIDTQNKLKSSVVIFQSKVTKENLARVHAQKMLKVKEHETEKLLQERNEIEAKHQNEKKNLKLAAIENEKRIKELKEILEEERKSKASEIAEAVAEQKKIVQRLKNAEKENQKLQDVIRLNENDLTTKQARIVQLENDLKEAEKIQSSIMSIMQRTKSTSK